MSALPRLALLALTLLAGGAAAQPVPGGHTPSLDPLGALKRPRPLVVPDPSTDAEFDCYYWGYYVWNAGDGVGPVEGRVYWPSDCDDPRPPGVHPLVLLIHGDGHDYTDYHYLMQHLAFNGFIAASINGGHLVTNVTRAERIRTYLGYLRNHWVYKDSIANNIGLIGHSRGGEAIFTAARKFGIGGAWAGQGHDINALIALAPTDSDANGGTEGHEALDGNACQALLVIYGSRDNDVHGYCTEGNVPEGCGQVPASVMRTGFALYDRAGSEVNTEPLPLLQDVVTKSMLFVDRADHNRWREIPCGNPGFIPLLSCETHKNIAKGYMNAFLRWQLRGKQQYEPFFTGQWMPAAVAMDDDVVIRTQYQPGYGRRVIDNFEGGGWQNGTLATVTKDLQVSVLAEAPLWQNPDYSAPHHTDGLVLRWSTVPIVIDPWIRWTIPDLQDLQGRRFRDVDGFGWLSFRVGIQAGSTWNTVDQPQDFTVRLADDGGTWSPKLPVSHYTTLAYPDDGLIHDIQVPWTNGFTPKSSLVTVRIPLAHFLGVDLENVADIQLDFGDDDHLSGEILLDSLEFCP